MDTTERLATHLQKSVQTRICTQRSAHGDHNTSRKPQGHTCETFMTGTCQRLYTQRTERNFPGYVSPTFTSNYINTEKFNNIMIWLLLFWRRRRTLESKKGQWKVKSLNSQSDHLLTYLQHLHLSSHQSSSESQSTLLTKYSVYTRNLIPVS